MKVLITGAHFTPAQAVIEELIRFESQESRVKSQVPLSLTLSHEGREDQTREKKGKIIASQDAPHLLESEIPRSRRPSPLPKERGLLQEAMEIVYVGRRTTREGDSSPSVESQVLPKLGVKFIPITAGRVRRFLSVGTVISLFKIPVGFFQAFFILLREKPDVVVSFGGYVAVPLVFCGWLLNIPIIVHEQTLVSGLANTFSQFFASKIAVSFDKKYSFDEGKLMVTGNPMRKGVLLGGRGKGEGGSREVENIIAEAKKEKKPLILITGGNQGSHVINLAVEEVLDRLLEKYCIVHQTGDSSFKDYERLVASCKSQESREKKQDSGRARMTGSGYLLKKWISEEDMGRLFSSVDMAVSRCGANTLLELAYHQVPTLMIPLAISLKDEQLKNARFFSEKGLGKVLLEKNLSGERLVEEIEGVLGDKELLGGIERVREVVILDAEKKLAQEIMLVPYRGE